MKQIKVTFPGGKRVDACIGEHIVRTDQSVSHGGEGSAPEPFDLFFVSIATCVGIYVLEFCTKRELDTSGLKVTLHSEFNPERRHYDRIVLELTLPQGFPEKYRESILRTASLCTVKKHITDPPEFEIVFSQEEH